MASSKGLFHRRRFLLLPTSRLRSNQMRFPVSILSNSSTFEGNDLSLDQEIAKLRLVVEVAEEMWG